jgi:hypothetical protein
MYEKLRPCQGDRRQELGGGAFLGRIRKDRITLGRILKGPNAVWAENGRNSSSGPPLARARLSWFRPFSSK